MFAVLFFVAVGMLFDPRIVRALGHGLRTALIVSAGSSQVGELSFVVAGLGTSLGLLPPEGRDLILAGALVSITLNAAMFAGVDRIVRWRERRELTLVDARISLPP